MIRAIFSIPGQYSSFSPANLQRRLRPRDRIYRIQVLPQPDLMPFLLNAAPSLFHSVFEIPSFSACCAGASCRQARPAELAPRTKRRECNCRPRHLKQKFVFLRIILPVNVPAPSLLLALTSAAAAACCLFQYEMREVQLKPGVYFMQAQNAAVEAEEGTVTRARVGTKQMPGCATNVAG